MHNDETIIRQMCILFSLVRYSDTDKTILTYVSVIPNLKFNFTKAKKWFNIKKNNSLLKLFNAGMLEHDTEKRTHIYWMHSVLLRQSENSRKQSYMSNVLRSYMNFQKIWNAANTGERPIPSSTLSHFHGLLRICLKII